MPFQISEFQSTINTYIPQRSNLFTMTIEGGPASALASGNSDTTIAWLCTATTFPGVTITPIEKPFFGRQQLKESLDKLAGEEYSDKFLLPFNPSSLLR